MITPQVLWVPFVICPYDTVVCACQKIFFLFCVITVEIWDFSTIILWNFLYLIFFSGNDALAQAIFIILVLPLGIPICTCRKFYLIGKLHRLFNLIYQNTSYQLSLTKVKWLLWASSTILLSIFFTLLTSSYCYLFFRFFQKSKKSHIIFRLVHYFSINFPPSIPVDLVTCKLNIWNFLRLKCCQITFFVFFRTGCGLAHRFWK